MARRTTTTTTTSIVSNHCPSSIGHDAPASVHTTKMTQTTKGRQKHDTAVLRISKLWQPGWSWSHSKSARLGAQMNKPRSTPPSTTAVTCCLKEYTAHEVLGTTRPFAHVSADSITEVHGL